jgi:hypothetical protein
MPKVMGRLNDYEPSFWVLAWGEQVDWLLHRRTRIESTSGTKESMRHALMMAEVGVPIAAGLLSDVNAPVVAGMAAATQAHEASGCAPADAAVAPPRVSH